MRKSILIVLLIAITIAIISLANIKRKEEPIDEIQEKGLAIMVYDESKKAYVKQDNFPVGSYKLSSDSYCTNGSPIGTYDRDTGTMITILNKPDKCYYYFDIKYPIITAVEANRGTGYSIIVTSITMDEEYDIDHYLFKYGSYERTFTSDDIKNSTEIYHADSSCSHTVTGIITAYLNDGTKSEDYSIQVQMACFVGDTLVCTIDGYKRIDELIKGDEVYSYNEETNTIEINKICKVFVHNDNRICKISVDNEIIEVTSEHPLYVKKKNSEKCEWIIVRDVEEGDYLYTSKGTFSEIKCVVFEERNEAVKVYDLEVENTHTYFVTNNNYLVHNYC